MAHFLVNAILTREVILWVPSLGKRSMLLVLVWCVPVVGAIIAYRSTACGWFRSRRDPSGQGGSGAGGVLLEMDAVFNPGKRHVIEARQEQKVEITLDEPK